jgi:hypothetical protein
MFQDDFGRIIFSKKEKIWQKIKVLPIIGPLCINILALLRATKNRNLPHKPNKVNKHVETKSNFKILSLKKGDLVKIRSVEEINKTLNDKSRFQGCEFMNTMWQFCGQKFMVLKRVDKILDPWTNKLRKCKNLVILEGLMCHGDPTHAASCDRTCLYYWNEAWLEKTAE